MPINEIFPNPVVKEVAFEVRFPNLFFLESRIGEFQIRVMRDFPESSIILRRNLVFAEGEPQKIQEAIAASKDAVDVSRVWQFKSRDGVELAVSTRSLSLVSQRHKSYRIGEQKFRDVIKSVLDHFIGLTGLPVLSRVGLRYIDDCPVPQGGTNQFRDFYNTSLATQRFPLETTNVMDFVAVSKRDQCSLRYAESLSVDGGNSKLILDFDAWTENVDVKDVMSVVDGLHATIRSEFEASIKDPVLQHMRGREER